MATSAGCSPLVLSHSAKYWGALLLGKQWWSTSSLKVHCIPSYDKLVRGVTAAGCLYRFTAEECMRMERVMCPSTSTIRFLSNEVGNTWAIIACAAVPESKQVNAHYLLIILGNPGRHHVLGSQLHQLLILFYHQFLACSHLRILSLKFCHGTPPGTSWTWHCFEETPRQLGSLPVGKQKIFLLSANCLITAVP